MTEADRIQLEAALLGLETQREHIRARLGGPTQTRTTVATVQPPRKPRFGRKVRPLSPEERGRLTTLARRDAQQLLAEKGLRR